MCNGSEVENHCPTVFPVSINEKSILPIRLSEVILDSLPPHLMANPLTNPVGFTLKICQASNNFSIPLVYTVIISHFSYRKSFLIVSLLLSSLCHSQFSTQPLEKSLENLNLITSFLSKTLCLPCISEEKAQVLNHSSGPF